MAATEQRSMSSSPHETLSDRHVELDNGTLSDNGMDEMTLQTALARKQRGNTKFGIGLYKEAIEDYKDAWGMFEELLIYPEADQDPNLDCVEDEISKTLANMAECHLRLEDWARAASCAKTALEVDPNNQKALYRHAKAKFHLGNYAESMVSAVRVKNKQGDVLCQNIKAKLSSTVKQHKLLFRRIIDSYRLRIEDEYAQTGDVSMHSLYGQMAGGAPHEEATPLKHFRAYVRMGVDQGKIPAKFSPDEQPGLPFQALCFMATTDKWSNIRYAVEQHDITEHYQKAGIKESVWTLRSFAESIVGPMNSMYYSDEPTRSISDYLSEEEEEEEE